MLNAFSVATPYEGSGTNAILVVTTNRGGLLNAFSNATLNEGEISGKIVGVLNAIPSVTLNEGNRPNAIPSVTPYEGTIPPSPRHLDKHRLKQAGHNGQRVR